MGWNGSPWVVWEGGRVRCFGRRGKGRVKGGNEERKGGECNVKWMDRVMRKTAKWGGGSLLTIVMSSSVEPQYALSV